MSTEAELSAIKQSIETLKNRATEDRSEMKEFKTQLNEHRIESAASMSRVEEKLDTVSNKINEATSIKMWFPVIVIGLAATAYVALKPLIS